jgi:hypothetical protein
MKLKGKIVEDGFQAFADESHIHAGHKILRIWVLVADRKNAHVYRKTCDGLERIAEAKADGGNPGIGSFHDDMNFIHGVAGWLDQAVRENAFDRMVLVAAPRTLGDLRGVLSKPVHIRVMAEVSKELTGLGHKALQKELTEIVWF